MPSTGGKPRARECSVPTRKPVIAEDWYQHSFDELYPIVYSHRSAEAAEPEALFAIEQMACEPSDTVLDLCCGNGRHMVHFKPHVNKLAGLDYSIDLLRQAQEDLGDEVCLVRADMRAIPFRETFDVIVNFFTSFGYFATHEENLGVVKEIVRCLRPGGRFFIDYINRHWAEKNLQPRTMRRQEGYIIEERRWIDAAHHRINKATTISRNGHRLSDAGESVRLYSRDEFTQLLEDGGLHITTVFGDYDGTPHSETTPRMIAIGLKAAS